MSYLALYREWRPQSFEDIVGQQHITKTLQNAIKADRIAHAYLFCGPRGTGKTTTAKVLAKALNCQQGTGMEPCNQCENCKRITDGVSMDVMEIDAASNRGIDEIRDLREKVKFSPTEGRYRIYIIDEVHMLTSEAFNALLKTLEEPPRHVLFILATTEPHKIPTTILSRCQRFDFKRIETGEIANRLREVCNHLQVETDEETLNLLAKTAEGGLRDALSILDQCMAFGGQRVSVEEVTTVLGTVNQELLFKMMERLITKDSTGALILVNDIVNQGKDLRQFSKDLTEHMRNLLLLKVTDKAEELIAVTTHTLNMLSEQATKTDRNMLVRGINIFSAVEREIRWSNQPRLVLELAVIEACLEADAYDVKELLTRIERLEEALRDNQAGLRTTIASKTNCDKGKNQEQKKQEERLQADKRSIEKRSEEKTNKEKDSLKKTTTSVEADFNVITNSWPQVMERLKKIKRTAHAFLIEGKPIELSGQYLLLGFDQEYVFHKESIEKQENRETIERLIQEVTGLPLKVKCKFNSDIKLGMKEAGNEEDPIVLKARELFGDNVIEFND